MDICYRFEDFVAETASVTRDTELYAALAKALAPYGYDKFMFVVFQDPRLPASAHQSGAYLQNVEGWHEFYTQKNYRRIDPMLRLLRSGAETFAWKDLPKLTRLSRAQEKFVQALGDFGMHQGVAVSLGNRAAAMGLGASTPDHATDPNFAMLNAIGNHAYAVFRRLHGENLVKHRAECDLTSAERDVITWLSQGKTDEDIACIMGISARTVDAHLRNMFRKRDATNRVSAVVRGIQCGYVAF